MAAAAAMDSTPDYRRYLSWANHELDRCGVRISWRDSDTPSDVDALLFATGNPPVPSERVPATDVQSWLRAGGLADVTSGRVFQVTILGADAVAMSLADTLATRGAKVRVIGPQTEIAPDSGRRAKILAVPRLAANTAVDIRLGARVVEAAQGRLLVQDASGTTEWVDAPGPVLASLGVLPVAADPAGVAPSVSCVEAAVVVTEPGPTTISAAVKEGYDAAQRLAGRLAAGTGVDQRVGVR
jgi:pyruvate/2-oxoglutarate dehydrogenase complex dihydrolipoamide dehydrogenase (E3) component